MKQTIESRLSALGQMFAAGLEKALAAGLKSDIPGPQGQQGVPGVPGTQGESSTVPGPVGATGQTGAVGPVGGIGPIGPQGPIGKQGVPGTSGRGGERGERGAAGPAGESIRGPQGEPGKDSVVTLEEVEKLILEIIGSSAVQSDALQKFVKLKKQIDVITTDPRYSRVDPHRTEIVKRLKQHYEPTSVFD